MDYLKEGIGLRAMAQRDPLVEYQREGFDLFVAMMEGIKEETVGFLFNVEVNHDHEAATDDGEPASTMLAGASSHRENSQLQYSAPSETGEPAAAVSRPKNDAYANVGRNEVCPCGSGKKFKKCHGSPTG